MQDMMAAFMVIGAAMGDCKGVKAIGMMTEGNLKVIDEICGEYYLMILLILF